MPFVRSNNQLTEGCYLQEEFAIFSLIGSFSFSGKSIVNYAQCANWTHSISVHSRNLFMSRINCDCPAITSAGRTWKRVRVDRENVPLRPLTLFSFSFTPRICTKWWGIPIDNSRTISAPQSPSASLLVARL